MDRINVYYTGNDVVAGVIERNLSSIKEDVLADEITSADPQGYVKEWSINGEKVTLGVEKNN